MLALLCLVLAVGCAFHAVDLGVTAEEGSYEPPEVCNSLCQDGWRHLSHRGDLWMRGADLFLLTTAAVVLLGYRARKNGHLA
jgi:hypothetical protein